MVKSCPGDSDSLYNFAGRLARRLYNQGNLAQPQRCGRVFRRRRQKREEVRELADGSNVLVKRIFQG